MTSDLFRLVETHQRKGIKNLEDLREHLQVSLAVEHATLPPYLTAYYSLQQAPNAPAARTIRNVAMEEMLHMVLAGNLLVSIGGAPSLTRPGFCMRYPGRLPDAAPDVRLGLLKFSPEAIADFMRIEHPPAADAPPEADHFHSLGQFLGALKDAFTKDPVRSEVLRYWEAHPPAETIGRQIGPEEFYGSGGAAIRVISLDTASLALTEILEQGEGHVHQEDDTIGAGNRQNVGGQWEPAHYYRFHQLLAGRHYLQGDKPGKPTGPHIPTDWSAVRNVRPNSRIGEFRAAGSRAVPKMEEFNRVYGRMLAGVEAAFRGDKLQFRQSVGAMMQLKVLAEEIMNIPSGFDDGTTAGPTFEPSF